MKICKVRPDYSTCSACVATQEMFNVVDDCSRCKLNTDTYELFDIVNIGLHFFLKNVRPYAASCSEA